MPHIRFAGQITGCEGYVESAAIGLLAARFAAAEIAGRELAPPPPETALGALVDHITGGADAETYQPMNVNFGLLPPIDDQMRKGRPQEKLHRPGTGGDGGVDERRENRRASRLTGTARGTFGGGGAVVAYSAGVSQPERSLSAEANLVTVFTAHSSKLSAPLPLASSLANAFRRGSNNSAAVIRPSSSLSARPKRFCSRVLGVDAGASGKVGGTTVNGVATRAAARAGAPRFAAPCPATAGTHRSASGKPPHPRRNIAPWHTP